MTVATPGSPSARRMIVVINPATKRNPDRIADTIAAAAPPGVELAIHRTQAGVSITELLGDDLTTADVVVAAGGDGTVAAVATALGDSGTPLGIVPAGSTNIIAREHRIPLNPAHAARLIFGSHSHRLLDTGICGERRFLHMAGAGIDSRLFLATDALAKQKRGWLAYVGPAMRSVAARPARFTIKDDDVTLDVMSPLVLVANGTSILKPFFPTFKDIRPDDGWLDVIVLTAVRPMPLVRTLSRFASGSLDRSAYVMRIRTRSVRICADPPLPVELDGDVVAETPAHFSVAPRALRLIVPEP